MSGKTSTERTQKTQNADRKGSNFEEAVAACGYGKFQYLQYLALLPAAWASLFDTSNTSMILPSVECDLGLTPLYKGLLNAAVYIGMVCSAPLWGFLGDVMGRRKILVYGLLIDGFLNILTGLSQGFWVLATFKFLSGFIISGPFAALVTYCSEFHCMKDRPRLLLLIGVFNTIGASANAVLAWIIIPHSWSFVFFNGGFIYNSWRLFMSSCGVPILIGATCLSFFPESPKFLMSQGRNEEALEVFRKMFSMNKGLPLETYEIRELEFEVEDSSTSNETKDLSNEGPGGSSRANVEKNGIKTTLRKGLKQMKPLFLNPFISQLVLVLLISFVILLGYNTIRLWQPQLFNILAHYENLEVEKPEDFTFCQILDHSRIIMANHTARNSRGPEYCKEIPVDTSIYYYNIILNTATTAIVLSAVLLVNLVGNKILLPIVLSIALFAIISINWSPNTIVTLALICIYCGVLSLSLNLNIGITVDLFPTSLRTMAVSLIMMTGRIGALLGNIMFPVLLEYGCFVPIIVLASFILLCIVLTFFIPKSNENLK